MIAIRVPVALAAGILSSVVIFLALFQLVSVPFDGAALEEARKIEFTAQRVDTPVVVERPPQPEVLPPPAAVIKPRGPSVDVTPINVRVPPSTQVVRPPRTGLPVGVDRDVTPLVRINPDYPPRAQANGIQGWAQVRFTVTTTGTVRDAVVVASEPGEVFDA